jgi:hypothetical protein
MLEPIGVVRVYVRPEDLRGNPYIPNDYLDLFCREWGVTPESSAMRLECDSALDKWLLSDPVIYEPHLAINGLVPLDGLEYVRCKEIGQLEGYLVLNRELHEALYSHPEDNFQTHYPITKKGNKMDLSGKAYENPKIVITKGSAKIAENTCIWFSDSALFHIDFLKQLRTGS